jgi:hypothetical protein
MTPILAIVVLVVVAWIVWSDLTFWRSRGKSVLVRLWRRR